MKTRCDYCEYFTAEHDFSFYSDEWGWICDRCADHHFHKCCDEWHYFEDECGCEE